jgi:hypothetical protein
MTSDMKTPPRKLHEVAGHGIRYISIVLLVGDNELFHLLPG